MKKRFYITFLVSILFFGLLYVGFGDIILEKINPTSSISPVEKDSEKENIVKETVEPKNKDEILFLLLGIDTYDLEKAGNERTDTMILSSVNFKTGEINMLSIPRDTRIPVRGKLDKANHAHAYGGLDLTLKTVEEFLNMDIDHFVKLDYKAVESIVTDIGGVDIDVPRRMKYDDTTKGKEFHVDLKPGMQTLDGDKAIQFLRWRKNNDGSGYPGGDVGRVEAQQVFMKEIIKQTLRPKNIFKLPSLARTYYDYVDTNIPLTTILKSVTMANKIDLDNIITSTVPGKGQYIGGVSYYIYHKEPLEEVLEDMFGNFIKK